MPPVSDPGASALPSKVGLRINPKIKIKKLKLVRCVIIFGLCSVEILWIAKGWIKQDSGFYKKNPRWRNLKKILRFFCSKTSLQNNISAFGLFWSSWNLLKGFFNTSLNPEISVLPSAPKRWRTKSPVGLPYLLCWLNERNSGGSLTPDPVWTYGRYLVTKSYS